MTYYATMPVKVWWDSLNINVTRNLVHNNNVGVYLQAHDVLQNIEAAEVVGKQARRVAKSIILDNGACELGTPVSAEDLLEAMRAVNPNIIVPPDVLGSPRMSRQLTLEFLEKFRQNRRAHGHSPKLMRVLHMDPEEGVTLYNAIDWYLEHMDDDGTLGPWGIPRIYDQEKYAYHYDIYRKNIVQELYKRNVQNPSIHLLGLSRPPMVMPAIECMHTFRYVRSIDSTIAIQLADAGVDLLAENSTDAGKAMDILCNFRGQSDRVWEQEHLTNLIQHNVLYMDRLCRLGF